MSEFLTYFALGMVIGALYVVVRDLIRLRKSRNDLRTMKPINSGIRPGQWVAIDPSEPKSEKGWRAPPVDSTLGWRGWNWNAHEKCLQSPAYQALWRDGECRVEHWDKGDAVRGVAGIHALWPVPKDWQHKDGNFGSFPVVGIVERYGHYVLGEDGWRAEWVIVRELAAHKSILEEVRKAYPGITVHERVCSENPWPTVTTWPNVAIAQLPPGSVSQAFANKVFNTTTVSAQQALGYLVLGGGGGGGCGGSGHIITTWIGGGDGGGAGTPPDCIGDPHEFP